MDASEEVEASLAAKFQVLFPLLDERQRRLLMGARRGCSGMAGYGWWRGRPVYGRALPGMAAEGPAGTGRHP
jgi:hypothetical protein